MMTTPVPDLLGEHGFVFNVRKPIGWTSNDVIRFVKHRVDAKVGHAGTLDPFADGVLLICVGKATKKVPELMALEKEYLTTIQLGLETDTLDLSGSIIKKNEKLSRPTVQRVKDVLPQFIGDIQQAPPTFSAIRVRGKRAYQLAREGKKVELEKRRVRIHSIDVLGVQGTRLTLEIRCSKGTYIRSLARDLGRALDMAAFVRKLTRTRIGDYGLENAESLDQLESLLTIKNQKTG